MLNGATGVIFEGALASRLHAPVHLYSDCTSIEALDSRVVIFSATRRSSVPPGRVSLLADRGPVQSEQVLHGADRAAHADEVRREVRQLHAALVAQGPRFACTDRSYLISLTPPLLPTAALPSEAGASTS